MKNHYFKLAFILFAGIVLINFLQSSTPETQDEKVYQDYFNKNYHIYALNHPERLDFAGEEVPLQLEDVRERFDRELHVNAYWQSNTLFYLKRANKWFPVIEPVLKENNVPDDFKYLALVESGLLQVVSPAGARGFWQFRESAATEFGLEVSKEVDERYHVEKATEAACKYLKKAKEKFGSWTMAAASYNVGMRGLQNQVDRQKEDYYHNLLLNEETSRYVFRILAAKEILSHPGTYGFHYRDEHLYKPLRFQIIEVDTAVKDWAVFAQDLGINYKTLKLLNPWLRQSYLYNRDKKTYEIKVPVEDDLAKFVLPRKNKVQTQTSATAPNDSLSH